MKLKFGIGIPCHNESQNIGRLLGELEHQFDSDFYPESVVVVSSASRDGTDEIVRKSIGQSSLPLVLITDNVRRGKAEAVNRIILELKEVDIIFLMSADVLPLPGCLRSLLRPFQDPMVGIAGGRPIPEGPEKNLIFQVTKFLWDLHHLIALSRPKSTEITAFRNILSSIDASTLVDEAELEQASFRRGYSIRYVPEALVRNQCPLTWRDYFRHRIRVTRGHLILAQKTKYILGTLSLRERFFALRRMSRQRRFPFTAAVLAIIAEGLIYGIAFFMSRMMLRTTGIWRVIRSSKRAFAGSGTYLPGGFGGE